MNLVDRVTRATALLFAANRQPEMSGDPLRRLTPSRKRDCHAAAEIAVDIVLEEAAKVDPEPEPCPKFCNRGMIGMDNCNVCGITGSVFRVRNKLFPNTSKGYSEARSAAIRALGEK